MSVTPVTDPRDNPTDEFIAEIRGRFPVEAELDRLLVRKMKKRPDPPYEQITLEDMVERLERMIAAKVGAGVTVSRPNWLTGGASKVQMQFDLVYSEGEVPSETLVIRMDPSEASNTTSRGREAELITLFRGLLPVPEVRWLDEDGTWFPEPALIYTYVSGVSKPTNRSSGEVIGLGTDFGPDLRAKLVPQFFEALATIHTLDVSGREFRTLEVPEQGSVESARLQLNRARRVWEEDRIVDYPLLDVAANWLENNLPVLDRVSVVHGDFRSGNFLFDEKSGQVTAWLDWERGYIGDRHRDLTWMTMREKGHYSDDGKTYFVCGLVPLDEFNDRYEEATGLPVVKENMKFYQILNCLQVITTTMATSQRVAKLGKSHQDVLLSRLRGIGPVASSELIDLLEGE